MTGQKILVVEDTPDIALAMSIELDEEGYDVRMAHTGAEALEEVAREAPDLAILDMQLPDTTGVELCEVIRKSHTIPVIIFSGVNAQASILKVIQRGAADYVLKGSGLAELVSRVKHHLRLAETAVESSTMQHDSLQPGDSDVVPDGRQRILVIEPDDSARASLVELLTYLGYRVTPATSGGEAMELLKEARPRVLVVALDSPRAGGLKLVQEARAAVSPARLGFIGTSRRLSPEAVRRAKYHGIAAFVTRPWNPGRIHLDMQQAIETAIEAARKTA